MFSTCVPASGMSRRITAFHNAKQTNESGKVAELHVAWQLQTLAATSVGYRMNKLLITVKMWY